MNEENKNSNIIKRKFNSFNEEVLPTDIDIQVNESKETLNKEIWDNDKLKKDVRITILKIAKAFNEYLNLKVPIKDIVFTGSLANFNWTLTSDIDIHLILNLNSFENSKEFIEEYISVKKSLWNENHNITIKQFEVELFAKDKESILSSKGIYSVMRDKWIQKPKKYTKEIDEIAIKEKAASIINEIDKLNYIKDNEEIVEKAEKIKEKIKNLRKAGLEKGGEYSIKNLTFKVLRKFGYLEKLSDIKTKAFDASLTLKENIPLQEKKQYIKKLINENNEVFVKEYGCLMVDFSIKNWDKIINIVKKEDIYDVEGYGIEKNPHVTALFGFIYEKTNYKNVEKEVKKILGKNKKILIELKNISLFKNKDFDVLKFDIDSKDLHTLNKILRKKFEYKNDHPDYHPHMTIAYLKPGTGDKYIKKLKKPIKFESSKFTYSYPPDKKHMFSLKNNINILGVENKINGMTPQKIEIIKNFINFTCNRLELEEPVEIYLHKGRDEYIATTASYVPDENSNHIRCDGRALVDILRSIGHELTHNRQREIKSFNVGEKVQTIGGWIEDEANSIAGILIKDFAMNYGFDEIYDL